MLICRMSRMLLSKMMLTEHNVDMDEHGVAQPEVAIVSMSMTSAI